MSKRIVRIKPYIVRAVGNGSLQITLNQLTHAEAGAEYTQYVDTLGKITLEPVIRPVDPQQVKNCVDVDE